MPKSIITTYWRAGLPELNLGDYVTEVLLEKLGYKVEYAGVAVAETPAEVACLFAVGTLLDADWMRRLPSSKVIWGSGGWGDTRLTESMLADCSFRLVRGPRTRREFNLPEQVPVGDPALLLSAMFPLPSTDERGVCYIPHFHERNECTSELMTALGAEYFINVGCTKNEFWVRIKAIVSSTFVMTSSLHGAIIAESYSKPWALVIPEGQKPNKPQKWQDWFELLEIDPRVCHNFAEAAEWWLTDGHKRKRVPIEPILNSFPHDIAFYQ